jgi:hypothetical protein
MPDKPPRKPAVAVRRLNVGLADQLDELTPEEVLAQVNATLRRRQAAAERRPNE